MRYYIVTFDREPFVSYRAFHDEFVGDPRIKRWWHYIQSCYIVGTDASPKEVSSLFIKATKKHGLSSTHLVMEVNMNQRQGMLTKDAWNWIRRNATNTSTS